MTRYVTTPPLSLDPSTIEKLLQFQDLLLKWNRKINLSAAREPAEIDEHIRDSLHVIPHLRGSTRVVDVGAGGGFPVIVAAICLPALSFTALEPVHKKHAFLRTAARELELANLEAFATRVEDHPIRDYDAATSRATFDLVEWLLLGAQLVHPGGLVLGFEATPRDDLPQPFERHSYLLDGKTRSIILVRRPT
ncbi:MAG TPA: 16S rRNA (guanine(527)-N(7))-methyltransferase RsmG [Kofleriaceae bacterium]|nr:16S rRNA (guanine(527)-N(7))-methyltransferase RsmG [Kofleriaceae bacterium]